MENKFEDKFANVLANYMQRKNVGYSYLLTGEWGIGKTFFCTNILPSKLCSNGNIEIINISLYGKKSIEDVNLELNLKILGEKANNISQKFIRRGLNLLSNCFNNSWLKLPISAFDIFSDSITEGRVRKEKEKIDIRNNRLIIFDDLERCAPQYLPDLLGEINAEFIEDGYHVLFVAYETELFQRYPEFKKKKEKLIRTTFSYEPDIKETVKFILETREKDSPSKESLLDKKIIEEIPQTLFKIRNFRTWIFALDVFDSVVIRANMNNHPYLYHLFTIILLDVYFYGVNPDLFDIDIYDSLSDEKIETISKAIKKTFDISASDFPDGMGREWKLSFRFDDYTDYYRLNEIEKYIRTGFFNADIFKEQFEKAFPVGSEYETAYVDQSKIHSMNIEEFQVLISTLSEGLEKNIYSIKQIVNIGVFITDLDEQNYLSLLNKKYDYKEMVVCSLNNKTTEDKVVFLQCFKDPLAYSDFSAYCSTKPDFIKTVFEKWQQLYDVNQEKEKFVNVFSKYHNYKFPELPYFAKEQVAKKIIEYNLLEEFLKFDCKGISLFSSYLDSISLSSNCGAISSYYSEITPLQTLNQKIKTAISSGILNGKEKIEFTLLCERIDTVCKKLEDTHDMK